MRVEIKQVVVEPPPKEVVLTLTMDEARLLLKLVGSLSGPNGFPKGPAVYNLPSHPGALPENLRKDLTDPLYYALSGKIGG